jgi:SAM-dependent methyltransferase
MRSSIPLFDRLAPQYDDHFRVPRRNAYDRLAWEQVRSLLPPTPGLIIDAGCGVGRWAPRLVGLGHRVVGIEQAPDMAAEARRRAERLDGRFLVIEASMEQVDLPAKCADAVLAMGSLQYTMDPRSAVKRFVRWVRPNRAVVLLVDSLVWIVIEQLRAFRWRDAAETLDTGRGVWRQGGEEADLHLLSRDQLTEIMTEAGLQDLRVCGLLISAVALGVQSMAEALQSDRAEKWFELEQRLMGYSVLADLGKHLLATGRSQ